MDFYCMEVFIDLPDVRVINQGRRKRTLAHCGMT